MDQNSSRHTATLLFALLLSGWVAGVARAQAPKPPATSPTPAASKPASPTGASPKAVKPEEYRALTRQDNLSCDVGESTIQGTMGFQMSYSGKIKEFVCSNGEGKTRSIELKSANVVDGKIETKAFGTILIDFANNGSAAYRMKESQIKKLKTFLASASAPAAARAQASTSPAANPIPAIAPTPAASKPAGPTFEAGTAVKTTVATVETPEPADKVVLKVGDQQFTKANIDFLVANLPPQTQQEIAAKGKRPLGEQYALIIMLSERARQQHLDQRPEFIQRAALQRQQLEAQEEINYVTPEELQKYYAAHAADFDQITVRQFVIRKKAAEPKADPAHPTASTSPGLAPEEAKARAEAIRKELAAGADIKKVMADFKAPGDVIIEPEPRTVRPGAMRPDLAKVAFALKDGEVSEPVDVPQALVFFQVSAHSHLDLKDATPDIQKTLRQQKVVDALAEVKKSPTVWMDEEYFGAPPKPPEGPTLGSPVVKPPAKP